MVHHVLRCHAVRSDGRGSQYLRRLCLSRLASRGHNRHLLALVFSLFSVANFPRDREAMSALDRPRALARKAATAMRLVKFRLAVSYSVSKTIRHEQEPAAHALRV